MYADIMDVHRCCYLLVSTVCLRYDKVSGFYTALHKTLEKDGEDGEVYCPRGQYQFIEKCLKLATCLLGPMVEAGEVTMAFYASMLEQVVQFDLLWENILKAFHEEFENATLPSTLSHFEFPKKYLCDLFERVEMQTVIASHASDSNGTALIERASKDASASRESSKHARTVALSTAMQHATRTSFQVLDSHQHNTSMEMTIQRLEEAWYPICREMQCDHTNYEDIDFPQHTHIPSMTCSFNFRKNKSFLKSDFTSPRGTLWVVFVCLCPWEDIYLSSFRQTMLLMKTSASPARLRAEIKNRALRPGRQSIFDAQKQLYNPPPKKKRRSKKKPPSAKVKGSFLFA